jgi:hypothetical protein
MSHLYLTIYTMIVSYCTRIGMSLDTASCTQSCFLEASETTVEEKEMRQTGTSIDLITKVMFLCDIGIGGLAWHTTGLALHSFWTRKA